jgi:hypothetical protein
LHCTAAMYANTKSMLPSTRRWKYVR